MKYVFVGDIHGKVEEVKRALDKEGTIIFVGDFMDSFDRSVAEHEECLTLVCDAVEQGKARAIYGNHDLQYIYQHHRCSGYDVHKAWVFKQHHERVINNFEFIVWLDDFVVTHAGIHPLIWEDYQESGKPIREWAADLNGKAHNIGRARGGWNKVGGIFWCDFNMEFEAIPNINQIFGHTAGRGIRTRHTENSKNFCIDCLDNERVFLEMEF